MKTSITLKLFVLIITLFLIQSVVQVGFQKYFLTDFYERDKIQKVESALDKTIASFSDTDSLQEQTGLINDYIAETGEPLIVYDDYFEYHPAALDIVYETTITLENKKGETFVVPFDSYVDPLLDEFEFNPNLIGLEVEYAYFYDEGFLMPYSVTINGQLYMFMFEEELDELNDMEFQFIQENMTLVNYRTVFIDDELNAKLDALDEYFYSDFTGDYVRPTNSNYEFIISEAPIDGMTYYFVTLVALQPINDVVSVQNKFQGYMFVLTFVLIVLMAIIVSKWVSKPIVKLTKVSKKYSDMDFSEVYSDKRHDEIGTLGTAVNYLAHSLKERIDDLADVNTKLGDDIAFERRQEQIRKEFVSNVSHELKTPLGVIKSYSEGIQDGISKDRESEYLDVIIEEVNKMNELIVDMLELTSLEANHNLEELETINFKRLVENVIRKFEQTTLEVNAEIDLEEAIVEVDIKKMEVVVANVLSNAFRYMIAPNRIRIVLRSYQDSIHLTVENSSEPIDETVLVKLFDRFFRVEKSRSRELGGNGLGLAIVKNVCDLHGFTCTCSNSDIGFKFELIMHKK